MGSRKNLKNTQMRDSYNFFKTKHRVMRMNRITQKICAFKPFGVDQLHLQCSNRHRSVSVCFSGVAYIDGDGLPLARGRQN